jgi:hypothetical protein
MRDRYMQALRCEGPKVIPHQVWLLHPEFISDATGVDYYEQPLTASLKFHERYDVDVGGPVHVSNTPLPRPNVGKTEDGGEVRDEGFSTVWHNESPFSEPEEMWEFDPDPWGKDCERAVEPNYATKNFRWAFQPELWPEMRARDVESWQKLTALFPGKFTYGTGLYTTSFMWAICIFGWDVFLMALGLDPEKTGETIQRISDISVRCFDYFAGLEILEFVGTHDDLTISSGPVTAPAWYREYIYPVYDRMFEPIRAQGKPVILTSDGDITKLASDLAEHVDGFIFESSTPPDYIFETFGQSKCLIGGIDVRPLTFGTPDDVEAEVRRAIERGRDCPGYIIACSDTIPANVPLANVYRYFDVVEELRHR